MSNPDVSRTETSLVLLRRLDQMPPPTRRSVTQWLWDHGLTPSTVVVGLPIDRDVVSGSVSWRELDPDGTVTRRWRFSSAADGGTWPAPFPELSELAEEHDAAEAPGRARAR